MAEGIFRPKYPPPGMTYKAARAAGALLESEVWWIRYRARRKTVRESTHTTRFEDARKLLNERRRSADRSERPASPKVNRATVAEMAEHLRAHYRTKGKHLPTLESRLGHLVAAFGERRIADLDIKDLTDYVEARQKAGVSNGTINRELEVLARAFTVGRDLQVLTVTLPVRALRLEEAAPRQGFFEDAPYEAVVRQLSPELRVACAIAHTFGWRMQSEVLALERRHVDLEHDTLKLDAAMTKTNQARTAALTAALRPLIVEQLARVDLAQRVLGRVIPYVFPHLRGPRRGQRIQDFRRAWRTACRRAGVPGMLRHDLGRTPVRNLIRAGVPDKVAMDITGHKTRSVFDRYDIVSTGDLEAAARKLDARATSQVLSQVGLKNAELG